MRSLIHVARASAHRLGLTNQARFERAIARDRVKHPKDFAFADEVLQAFHSQGGLRQYTQVYKLVSLIRLLQAEKPGSILELGTGSSSVVFAMYAGETGATVIHVDESAQWLENTRKNVKSFATVRQSQFYLAPAVADLTATPPSFRYRYSVDRAYDMIFIDGPALVADSQEYKHAVCGDIFEVPKQLIPALVVVDMRKPTVEAMIRRLGDIYRVEISDVLARRPQDNFRYYSIFRRTQTDSDVSE